MGVSSIRASNSASLSGFLPRSRSSNATLLSSKKLLALRQVVQVALPKYCILAGIVLSSSLVSEVGLGGVSRLLHLQAREPLSAERFHESGAIANVQHAAA